MLCLMELPQYVQKFCNFNRIWLKIKYVGLEKNENEYQFLFNSYRVRIEGMLIKEEFTNDMEWIRPSIEAVIIASKGNPLSFSQNLSFELGGIEILIANIRKKI